MDDNDTLTGKHSERWEQLKKELGNCGNEYIAGLLLDSWYKRNTLFCKKCGAVVSEQEAVYPDPPPYSRTTVKISNVEKPDLSLNLNNRDVDDDGYDANSSKDEEDDSENDHVTHKNFVTHSQSEDNWKQQANNIKIQQSEQELSSLVMENRNGASNNVKQVDVILSQSSVRTNTNFPSAGILVRNCAILNKMPSELFAESTETSCSGEMYMQLPKEGNMSGEKSAGDEPGTIDGTNLPQIVRVLPDPPVTFENKSKMVAKASSDIEENVEANDSSNSFSIKVEPEEDNSDDNNYAAEKPYLVIGEGVLDMSCSERESSDESCSDNVPVRTTQQRHQVGKRSRRKISTVKQNVKIRKKLRKEKYDESFFGKAKSSYLEQSVEEEKILDEGKQTDGSRRRSGRLKDKKKISFSKMMQYEHKLMESDKELDDDPEDSIEKKHSKTEKKRKKDSTQKHKEPPKKKSIATEHNNSLVTKGENPAENLTGQQGHESPDMSEDNDELKVEDLLEQADNMDESGDDSEDGKSENKDQVQKKTLCVDPDFDPLPGEGSQSSDSESSTDDEDYKPDESELKMLKRFDNKVIKERTDRIKRKYVKKKDKEVIVKRKRVCTKPKRTPYPKIEVKLEDHADKFERTIFTSHAKSDRCIDEKLKSYERYTCKLCNGDFNTTDQPSMESHITLHLQGRLTCQDCGIIFSRLKKVQVHRTKFHSQENYMCEHCAKDFGYLKTLQRHLAKDHGENPFCCTKCTEKFISHDARKMHMFEKHPGTAVKCDKCGEIFLGKYIKKEHVGSTACLRRANEIPQETQCEHCGKMITTNTLAAHVRRAHHKIHVHRCELCPYTTNSEYNIVHHRMTHTGERPHRCDLCNFSCIYICQLKSHMRTHTGDKPYKCDLCSYASAWNVQLKGHKKAHESLTKVDCQKCNIAFKDEKGLSFHNKKEHQQSDWSGGMVPETSFVPAYRPMIKHEGANYS